MLKCQQLLHFNIYEQEKNHAQLNFFPAHKCLFHAQLRERSGLVVECLTPDRGAAGSSLTGVCVVSLSKSINPSLVLVQPRKTRPFITERLLMGRKESNQTNYAQLR